MSESDEEPSTSSADSGTDDEDYAVHPESTDEDETGNGNLSGVSPSSIEEERKKQNVDALLRGNLVVKRQALLPRVLSVSEGAAVARKPFKPPSANGYSGEREIARRLWARKQFVPWGSSRPFLHPITNRLNLSLSGAVENAEPEEREVLPPGIEPLVLWQPEDSNVNGVLVPPVVVESLLVRFLRPHQREGVQFMFECVSGLLEEHGINGCILADDMGLGKTLQSISLLYTLLRQGFDGKPMVKRVMVITPTSLVTNWESEINKWLNGRVKLISLCESTRADVVAGIDKFLAVCSQYQILIVSYETFRIHSSRFNKEGCCDLLICDEAHRLKNDQTRTNRALAALPCRRRILLSGTPMQNDLEEFYAMVDFTNPGILGDATHFRRYYETPIVCGREPTASTEEKKLGLERSTELSTKVNQFILRRTNTLLSQHLPPKIVEVVCCRLTPLQAALYTHFIMSKNVKQAIVDEAKKSKMLAYITALKKLCNHPKLIYDTIRSGTSGSSGFEDCLRLFPPELFSGRTGSWTGGDGIWVELSGKMHVLARFLAHLRLRTNDRIVLVSNYTQTLDLFAQLCRERRYPFLRLDGTTSISKRQKLVNRFNDFSQDEFAFLLSSKAGGCGLNLIGGNRLVLFDPDWNPANDKQAAARVWRDGQKKRVYIYRFLTTGTIEEKVYQRQMSKEGLQKVIQQEQLENLDSQVNLLSTEVLRDLFTFHEHVRSEIHEKMNCSRCHSINSQSEDKPQGLLLDLSGKEEIEGEHLSENAFDIGGFAAIAGCVQKLKSSEKQLGTPFEEDLVSWGHHTSASTVPDPILQASAGDEVTFVFTNQVDGKLVPIESTLRESANQERPAGNHNSLSCQNLSLPTSTQSMGKKRVPLLSLCKGPKYRQTTIKHSISSVNKSDRQCAPEKIQLPAKRTAETNFDDDFV